MRVGHTGVGLINVDVTRITVYSMNFHPGMVYLSPTCVKLGVVYYSQITDTPGILPLLPT